MNVYCSRAGEKVRRLALCLCLLLSLPAWADPIQLVSDFQSSAPSGGNGDSCLPIVSADGRYVLFASAANDLLFSSNGLPIPSLLPTKFNVYLRDRSNLDTRLISVSTNGIAGGNGHSFPMALSTNSQFVLFESSASDLISGDTNNATDIFLADMATGVTWLVSASTNGFAANGASRKPVMTPDGRYVAFVSEASNLVAGDTNKIPDVFVRDMQTLTTTLISVRAIATNYTAIFPSGGSESPQISVDGRFVAFSSTATNLVPGVRSVGDIYVHDRLAGTNLWASSGMRAKLQSVTGRTNGVCYNLALSDDGKFVAYQASVAPLGAGTNTGIILRYGLETEVTDLIHTNAPTSIPMPEETRNLDLSADGSILAFVANSNGIQATTTCVQVWNATSAMTTLVSGNLSNRVTTGSLSTRPVINADGRYVAFLSSATNLVTNSISGPWHLYVRDLQTLTTTLVDESANGMSASLISSSVPSFTANGRIVVFESGDGGLVADDYNRNFDVFVRDLDAGMTELVSSHHAALVSESLSGPSLVSAFASSSDGRFVTYASETKQSPSETNDYRNVFVRDLASSSNSLVSCSPAGLAGNGMSSEPAISGDGRFVAFTSSATNLVTGDTNKVSDVFVRDLQAGTTVLASIKPNGGTANSNSYSPMLSVDGRWLLFRSQAKDLVAGASFGLENLFLRDTVLLTNRALTVSGVNASAMTPDGRFIAFVGLIPGSSFPYLYVWDSSLGARVFTNITSGISNVAISSDGNLIAYNTATQLRLINRALSTNSLLLTISASSRPVPRFSADGKWLTYTRFVAPWQQVFLYNLSNQTEQIVSHALGSASGGGGHSDLPEITADGRFVVYRTFATNIVLGVNGITRQLILYDRQTGLNTLVSASRYTGLPGDDHSLRASFSADGQTLLLQSWASDLAAGDFNRTGDVLARPIFTAVIFPAGVGESPWIYWPLIPDKSYDVQFKTDLNDPDWQSATGVMTNSGNKVWFRDDVATDVQRFYRVRSF